MSEDKKQDNDFFFQDVIKKTKTGITFPKELREALFEENEEVFFKITIPNEKNKIILEFLSETEAKILSEKIQSSKPKALKKAPTKVYMKILSI